MRSNNIRCRWCNWTTFRWKRRNGRDISGWARLKEHVCEEHPEKYEELRDYLDGSNLNADCQEGGAFTS